MTSRRRTDKNTSLFSANPTAPNTDWALIANVLATPFVRTAYIWGPPGLGKTYSAYHSGRTKDGVYAITMTEDTPAAELRGHYLPTPEGMVWHDGPFTAAMRAGARLVVNEVSHGAPEALSILHPVLESAATAQITLPTNETVKPALGFHVICTDNASPSELPLALRDRFDVTLEVTDPHPEALAGLEEPFRSAAQRTFALEEERRVSLRGWLSVQGLTRELGLETACVAVFGRERGAQILDGLVLLREQLER